MRRDNTRAAVLAGLLAVAATLAAVGAAAQDRGLYTGQLVLLPACPAWTFEADGRKLPIKQNEALYSLFGTYYGGDGTTNFGLPDLRDQAGVAGYRYCVVNHGQFPTRQ